MNQSNLFATALQTRNDLRDYQHDAIVSLFEYFDSNDGSPLIVIPTGGGKSMVIAEFSREAMEYFPGTTITVVSHSALLLEQNAQELLAQWPQADISFYSDTIGQKNLYGSTVFAGIQSIYKKAYDYPKAPDLILVDEAHLIGPEDGSMYRKFFDDVMAINPYCKIAGFTATPFRAGYGMLHKGKNALFTHIAYEISVAELIGRGYLAPIITPEGGMRTKMNVQDVKTTKGDYIQSQLAKAVDDSGLTRACVDEIMTYGIDRRKWMVFTVDINHCMHVTEELRSRGVECVMVHSKMDQGEISYARDKFKNGNAQCMVNVAMLTTGANFPAIDLLAFMRPTRSPVLYVQMAGRGMRLFPGKSDCLLLDFGGVVEELGPIDAIKIREPGPGSGEAPIKFCPGELPDKKICNATLPASQMTCPHCGYKFPDPGLNIGTTASDAAVLTAQLKPKIKKVTRVGYYRHKKEGKPDTLRVDYLCGFDTYREWVHLEHSGFPRERACNWWKKRANSAAPRNINEALARTKELMEPRNISVRKIGKYFEIVEHDFGYDEPEEENEPSINDSDTADVS